MENSRMGLIRDFAATVFADGPTSAPSQPPKSGARALFGLIDANLSNLINGLVIGGAVVYATRAALFADLARPANTLGIVYNDSTLAYNGVYVKAGASGSGSWSLTGLALPSSFAVDLSAVVSEVAAARNGAGSLDARLDAELAAFNDLSGDVDTIAGEITTARNGEGSLAQRLLSIVQLISDLSEDVQPVVDEVIDARGGEDSLAARFLATVQLISELSAVVESFGINPVDVFGWAHAFVGANNKPIAGIRPDGTFAAQGFEFSDGRLLEGDTGDWEQATVGKTGKPICGIKDGDFVVGHAGASADLKMLAKEPGLLARSASMSFPSNEGFARPAWDYNIVIGYGQSLSVGQQAWARWVAEDTPTRTDTWMIGNSVRPVTDQTAAWAPIGGSAVLTQLKATVEAPDDSGTILSPSAVDALATDSQALGFNPLIGAVRYVARAFEDVQFFRKNWLAYSAGSGGKTIEQLTPGASPNLYNRLVQGGAAAVAAVPGGATKGVVAVSIMQGENNYASVGGDRTKAGYKAKLSAVLDAIDATNAAATGQTRKALKLTYQTGGGYVADDTPTPLSIAMAQWELSLERGDVVMVGPVYQMTDKAGHLTADGSAWYSQQLGKVMHRVLTLGQRWEPLSPLWTDRAGQTVYIGYHVPEPPIVLGTPYDILTATDFRDKGFRVQDSLGYVAIDAVRVVGASIIAIDLARSPLPDATVWYAGKTGFNGGGCVRDSDATVADAVYRSSDIPALTGKPYPLHNWSIASWLPVGWSR
jgi:hypothetical protein